MPSLLLLRGMAEPNLCPCVDIAPSANSSPIARLFLLLKEETILGRGQSVNGIRIDDIHAHKGRHGRIFPEHNLLFFEDAGIPGNTQINFVTIYEPAQLREGDLISVGDFLVLFSDANNAPPGAHTVPTNEQPLHQSFWEPLAWPHPIVERHRTRSSPFYFSLAYRELVSSCVVGRTSDWQNAPRFAVRADVLRSWLAKNDPNTVKKSLSRLEEKFLLSLFTLVNSICPGQSTSNPLLASACACRDYWFSWIRELFHALNALAGVRLYDPRWLEWNDHLIPDLALGIRERRTFEDLPILADALEEAGCQDSAILEHCRQPEGHPGACWVVEMLLAESLHRKDADAISLGAS